MKVIASLNNTIVSEALLMGQSIVALTDTVYGILACATDRNAVARLYRIRHRDPTKSSIILVSSIDQVPGLTDSLAVKYQQLNNTYPTTIVVDTPPNYLAHLPRQGQSLAFRVVNQPQLNELLNQVGPLIAPSANLEGQPIARSIVEARDYFGEDVAIYVDSGTKLNGHASRIVKIHQNNIETIRA